MLTLSDKAHGDNTGFAPLPLAQDGAGIFDRHDKNVRRVGAFNVAVVNDEQPLLERDLRLVGTKNRLSFFLPCCPLVWGNMQRIR